MFDLRAISSVAPMGDLVFGLVVMLAAMAIANLAILPKLFSRDRRAAQWLSAVTLAGVAASVVTLALWPRALYFAVLVYVIAFASIGVAVSWRSIGWPHAIARIGGGTACMFVALVVACAAAFLPR